MKLSTLQLAILLSGSLCIADPATAHQIFGNTSLRGTYAYTNMHDNVASFGSIVFDGAGRLSLNIKVNIPDESEGRKVVDLTGSGTYTVEGDGTGTATIKFKGTDVDQDGTFDFVITETTAGGKERVASEVFAVQRSGGLKGQLVAPLWKRRGD